ncbi:MAG TPA: biotin/lipoyl-binding protein [Patescibacteria group bacterium]|jgi:multidrug efflux pump subunit AcrA (membrane-fusion protein)|nr:biotin/lipoyl-binding protein [Patescibacteria group bacterium]
MNRKRIVIVLGLVALLIIAGVVVRNPVAYSKTNAGPTTTTSVQFVQSSITADGAVTAQDEAVLNFQLAGKLQYLPVKVGDKVYQGQTIASLDSYALRQELQLASNAYQLVKNGTDQTQEYKQAGILEGQTRYALDLSNKQGYAAVTEATVVYDTVQRIVDDDLLAQNSAQIGVDLAKYAVTLASLTSPINGIITYEDVTVPGVNITPVTTFVVADPASMVFRANVPLENIYYISVGSPVTLAIDGIAHKITGTVVKIFPTKVTLKSGQAVYQVDVVSDELKKLAKLDMTGSAIISTNSDNVALVPAWTVLGGKYVWVDNNGTPELRTVTAGKIHGKEIEITSGLSPNDNIITDPKFISTRKYLML